MKKIYLLALCLAIFSIGFGLPSLIKRDLNAFYSEKKAVVSTKPSPPKPSPKYVLKATKRAGIISQVNGFSSLLVPTVTAAQSVEVQGGGNPVPGGQLNYTFLLNNAGTDATAVTFSDVLVNDLTLVAGSLKATPIGVNDAYSVIGNVGITVPAGSGVLVNDVSPDATGLTVAVTTNVTKGTLVLTTDGSFTYTPNVGYSGTDSFVYTVTSSNGTTSTNNTVTLTVSAPIWFVNNAAASNGTGTLASPFKDWSNFATANALTGAIDPAANQTIFVYSGTYLGSAILKVGQKVLGQGASVGLASFAGATVQPYTNTLPSTSGTRPNLTSSGTTITVSTFNSLRGFDMGNSTIDIAGANFSPLTINEMALNGNGQALSLVNGLLTATFSNISSTNSAADGINLISVSGTLTNTGTTTITNPSGFGIGVFSSSSVTSNFGNTSITGSGNIALAVTGANSNSAALTFGDLDIAPDATQPAINYFGGGSFTCTSGTITATNISGDIGGIRLTGASSATKATLSVVLDSFTMTGTAGTNLGLVIGNTLGSFTINGTGTSAGSGGTISTIANRGVEISTASNITLKNMNFTNANTANLVPGASLDANNYSISNGGIVASGVTGLTLNNLNINGTVQRGIAGHNVSGFSMTNCTVNNSGDEGREGAIAFTNLSGTCSISGSTITRANEHLISIQNTNVNLNLTISNSNISDTQSTPAGTASSFQGTGILANTFGSGKTYITVSNCTLNKIGADGIKAINNDTSIGSYEITGCTIDPVNAVVQPNDVGTAIEITSNETSTIYTNIHDNTKLSANGGNVVTIAPTENSTIHTKFTNNTITYKSGGISGVFRGVEIFGQDDARGYASITGNNIANWPTQSNAIMVDNRSTLPTNAGNGRIDAIITGNFVSMINASATGRCITLEAGNVSTSSNIVCASVANNTTSTLSSVGNFRVSSFGATSAVRLEGSTDAPTAWNNNGNTPTTGNGGIVSVRSGSTVTIVPANTCIAPSNPPAFRIGVEEIAEVVVKEELETNIADIEKITEKAGIINDSGDSNSLNLAENSNSNTNAIVNNNSQSGETITVNGSGSGFTIPQNKSTTITFSATIANPTVSCVLGNFATVSGSNFADVNSNTTNTTLVIPPITGSTISSPTVCSGGTINLTATCPIGSTTNWYTENGGGAAVLLDNSAYSPTNITTGTSYFAACQIGACVSTRTLVGTVSVNALPDASITSPNSVCQNSTLNLSVASAGVGATYLWSGHEIVPANSASTTAVPKIYGVLTYSVSITDANGCTAQSTKNVTVNAQPAVSVSPNQTICEGTSASLSAECLMNVSALLSGASEVPSNTSTATGYATGTYNIVTKELKLAITYSGLTGNPTLAHIHGPAPVGTNAGVLIDFAGLFPATTSGTFNYTGILTGTNETRMLAGNTYINIHTSMFGGGEIRGQISATACAADTYVWNPGAIAGQSIVVSPSVTQIYTLTASNSGTGCSVDALTTVNVDPVTLPTAFATATQTVSNVPLVANGCEYLAKVVPTNFTGNATVKVWVEDIPPFIYVPRHYEIIPVTAPAATSNAEITLFFSQADFDAYNATSPGALLPTGPMDLAAIDNFQIVKYAGESVPNDGLPGHYTGSPTIIPHPSSAWNTDGNVFVWNATNSYWEVTFSISGFSGFFAKSVSQPLPVNLISFSGKKTGENENTLNWVTANEKSFSHFEIQRSENAKKFDSIGEVKGINSENYQFVDNQAKGINYYRLKMIDLDGRYNYSKTISIENTIERSIVGNFYPNPTSGKVYVDINAMEKGNWNITTYDVVGKIVNTETKILQKGINKVALEKLALGVNFVKFETEKVSEIRKIIKN